MPSSGWRGIGEFYRTRELLASANAMPTRFSVLFLLSSALLVIAAATGCLTSTQRVSIQCVPEEVKVYVDGRLLEGGAAEGVVLRTDEPHKIFVKGPGYEPQLVVLEPTVDAEGHETLGPDDVCIEVVPVGMHRELDLEMEADIEEEPPIGR
jgi:hypothetical protein